MALYSLHCGDKIIVKVNYKAENMQALSKTEINNIHELARNTTEYKNFGHFLGGSLSIKLDASNLLYL